MLELFKRCYESIVKRGLQFEIIPSGHMKRVKRTKITVKAENKRDLECIKVSGG